MKIFQVKMTIVLLSKKNNNDYNKIVRVKEVVGIVLFYFLKQIGRLVVYIQKINK